MALPRPSEHRDVRRRAAGTLFRRVSGGPFEMRPPPAEERTERALALILEHMETGVPVGREDQPALSHVAIARQRIARHPRPRVDHLLGARRYPRRDFLRLILIADVEHAHARVVVRR